MTANTNRCGVLVNWARRMEDTPLCCDSGSRAIAASPQLWAAWTACVVTKRCARAAFAARQRSMTAPDALEQVGVVFDELFPLDSDSELREGSL